MNRHRPPSLGFPGRVAPSDCVTAIIDGAARGNPGPAAYGVVFEDAGRKVLGQLASRLGRATNNVAEYRALLAALTHARAQGWRALKVRTDSELLARQLHGDYRVRSADLKPLHDQAQQLILKLNYFAVEAVARKLTRAADRLANAALDRRVARPATHGVPAAAKHTMRAIYQNGVLRPLQPLDLTDGDEVELTLRRPPRK